VRPIEVTRKQFARLLRNAKQAGNDRNVTSERKQIARQVRRWMRQVAWSLDDAGDRDVVLDCAEAIYKRILESKV
jgi:hypothetical protein